MSDWTDEEKRILLAVYPISGSVGCMKAGIKKSRTAITSYARKRCIYTDNRKPAGGDWQEWEEVVIREYFPSEGATGCISRGIKRIVKCICDKAAKMGVARIENNYKRLRPLTDHEKEIIEQYYPAGGSRAVKKHIDLTTRRIQDYARYNELVYQPASCIGMVIKGLEVVEETLNPHRIVVRCTRCGNKKKPTKPAIFRAGKVGCTCSRWIEIPNDIDAGAPEKEERPVPQINAGYMRTLSDAYSGKTSRLLRIGA